MPLPRIRRRADFVAITRLGRRAVTDALTIETRPAAHAGWQVGFTCSRRIGGAVIRNRARRRLRALADRLIPIWAMPGHDIVLVARPGAAARSASALENDLWHGLGRLRLRRADARRESS